MAGLGWMDCWGRWAPLLVLCACGPQVVLEETADTDAMADASTGQAEASSGSAGTPSTTAVPQPDPDPDPDPDGGTSSPPPEPGTSTGPDTADGTTFDGSTTDGPVEPGGAGPGAAPDDADDVELPAADVVAAAIYTDGELLDFRVQFAAPPFVDEASYIVLWCFAYDAGGNGSCGTHADDIDAYLALAQQGAAGEFATAEPAIDLCEQGSFESETNTLRIVVPAAEFPGVAEFRWLLTVSFGGSGGNNEWVPDEGDLEVTFVDQFPPFAGEPTC